MIGTVVDTPFGADVPHGIEMVLDMRDSDILSEARGHRHNVYSHDLGEGEGPI